MAVDLILPKKIRELDDDELQKVYIWVDEIPLSRPKKNMARDFSDGVLIAEVAKHFLPRVVELHNYVASHSTRLKENNWYLLNRKVFLKLNFEISPEVIRRLTQCKLWYIENVLIILREKIENYLAKLHSSQPKGQEDQGHRLLEGRHERVQALHGFNDFLNDQPEADQNYTPQFPWEDHSASYGKSYTVHTKDNLSPKRQSPRKAGGSNKEQMKSPEMVPKALLEEKQKELEVREETVEILQGKIKRLEQLVNLKDVRIEDLTCQLEKLEVHLDHTSPPRKPNGAHLTYSTRGNLPHPGPSGGVRPAEKFQHPHSNYPKPLYGTHN